MIVLLLLLSASCCLAQLRGPPGPGGFPVGPGGISGPSIGPPGRHTGGTPAGQPAAGGWVTAITEYQWVVGVHRRVGNEPFQQICGGSLISDSIILSAAHCFWNYGNEVPLDQYRISAGNWYRDLKYIPVDKELQLADVIFHERYRGMELSYSHDIAIIRLKRSVVDIPEAIPISIDWNPEFSDNELEGQSGTVVGWGFTEYNEPSFARIAVSLAYVDFNTCWNTVPPEFRTSITADKFCAGLRNGTNVCPGDSGGGLAFMAKNKVWYLRGIVSVGVVPTGDSKCHTTQFSAFTSISVYRFWLKEKLSEFGISPA